MDIIWPMHNVKGQGQRSIGSKVKSGNRWTDGSDCITSRANVVGNKKNNINDSYVFRPRRTYSVSGLFFYRPSSMSALSVGRSVCLSVGPSVGNEHVLWKNGWLNRDAILGGGSCGPKKPCVVRNRVLHGRAHWRHPANTFERLW